MEPSLVVWAEHVPFAELVSRRVLDPLAMRGLGLRAAVRPWSLRHAGELVRACRDAGVHLALWPMLGDGDGRWASASNAELYCGFAERIASELGGARLLPDSIVFDLEPPIAAVRALLRAIPDPSVFQGRAPHAARRGGLAVGRLRAAGLVVHAAAVALVAFDARARFQRVLGTPVDAPGFTRVDAMAYASLFEGYSRGLLARADALALVYAVARRVRARYGPRGALALGCVGPGALGDERAYRDTAELADDVAAVRAAGVDSLSLFDLGGVLERPPAGAWLDAFCEPARRVPAMTPRALWLERALAWAAGDRAAPLTR